MDKFPEFSTDELVSWLQAKYRRHGEIEDGVAAERLQLLSAENKVMRDALKYIDDVANTLDDAEHVARTAQSMIADIQSDAVSTQQSLLECPDCGEKSLAPDGWCVNDQCEGEYDPA